MDTKNKKQTLLKNLPGVDHILEIAQAEPFFENIQDVVIPVLNDVVLNQVLVAFRRDQAKQRVIERLQGEGARWCGGTVHQGRSAMQISVSSWAEERIKSFPCSFSVGEISVRSAYRDSRVDPGHRADYNGFRVCVVSLQD